MGHGWTGPSVCVRSGEGRVGSGGEGGGGWCVCPRAVAGLEVEAGAGMEVEGWEVWESGRRRVCVRACWSRGWKWKWKWKWESWKRWKWKAGPGSGASRRTAGRGPGAGGCGSDVGERLRNGKWILVSE